MRNQATQACGLQDLLRKAIRMAKNKNRNSADVLQAKLIKDREGKMLVDDGDIKKRWREYFEDLLNVENERIERIVKPIADTEIEPITREEVGRALSKMKRGKAVCPDGSVEMPG